MDFGVGVVKVLSFGFWMLGEMTTGNWLTLLGVIVVAVGITLEELWRRRRGKDNGSGGDNNNGPDGGGPFDLVLKKYGQEVAQRVRGEQEIGELKGELEKAIERIKGFKEKGQKAEAVEVLRELRESGETGRLLQLLIQDREVHRDALLERNREIASVAFLKGDIAEALAAVEEILAIEPEDMGAINWKGRILILQGDLEGAEECYQEVLKLGCCSVIQSHARRHSISSRVYGGRSRLFRFLVFCTSRSVGIPLACRYCWQSGSVSASGLP